MATPEDYRRYAEKCMEVARTIESAQSRALLIQMAQVWARLAEQRANATHEQQTD